MTDLLLSSLGWTPHFASQVEPGKACTPARITGVERSHILALGATGPLRLLVPQGTGSTAVGDWVLHDGTTVTRRLAPRTELVRRNAGDTSRRQLIASNVDTLGVVTSCNADFNPARLERYLSVAAQAGCAPLVILTKADKADPEPYLEQARALSPLVVALALNAKHPEEVVERLTPWVSEGRTLALVGSSGVGKTTIQNALTGVQAATQDIRADDAKGRHTTTARALRRTLAGGCLIDTPGIRELGLVDAAEGVGEVFSDLVDLASNCRFRDCSHDREPGCAIQAAIAAGTLDPDRLRRFQKLEREDRAHTEALHQRHARDRTFGKATSQGAARAKWKRRGPEAEE
ncbi:ribosome small subunit-dependent GTPase A [Rubellimicrobium aerolatum]|uniref:Small ribosomal subunit biogenesis GTPase RsgA n=1 Tax=Rubellimicrobium aerolatum TaxID=490979 RepID=A0ABW0SCL8_9RHOB|nr:ribosome biogenesis GTPase [Rubellimicrobium aerolatum]